MLRLEGDPPPARKPRPPERETEAAREGVEAWSMGADIMRGEVVQGKSDLSILGVVKVGILLWR